MAAAANDSDRDSYYSLLNVSKAATTAEINASFRRLCVICHPDKHTDAQAKSAAEKLFARVKEAHAALSDPEKRTIYDIYGREGLDAGWEVIARTRTPTEIRDEYERLRRLREEENVRRSTNPCGATTIGVNATDLFDSYDDDERRIELSGMTMQQQIDAPLPTGNDAVTVSGSLSAKNGRGHGHVAVLLRHVVRADRWVEVDGTAGDGYQFGGRVFANVTRHVQAMAGISLVSTLYGLSPLFTANLSRRLDDNLTGQLTLRTGFQSSMRSTLVHETPSHRFALIVQLGFQQSFIQASCLYRFRDDDDTNVSVSGKVGVTSIYVECGLEKQVSKNSRLGATMSVGLPRGVVLKLKLVRASQEFRIPIALSEEFVPEAVLYGTVVPLAVYWLAKYFVIDPFVKRKAEQDRVERQRASAADTERKKAEAEAAIRLMKETYERNVANETQRNGLVITEAWYGKLVGNESDETGKVINVTIPVQCLVRDSKLILHETETKSGLAGFCDPCLGEEKRLRVVYMFRGSAHEVTVEDSKELVIPRMSHKVE